MGVTPGKPERMGDSLAQRQETNPCGTSPTGLGVWWEAAAWPLVAGGGGGPCGPAARTVSLPKPPSQARFLRLLSGAQPAAGHGPHVQGEA